MKRVIDFLKPRYLWFVISVAVIGGLWVATIVQGGFNLGLDFKAGLMRRIQIAPVALTVAYTGEGAATLSVGSSGFVTVKVTLGEETSTTEYGSEAYPTLESLARGLNQIAGKNAALSGSGSDSTTLLVGKDAPAVLSGVPVPVNASLADKTKVFVTIADMKKALAAVPNVAVTSVGADENQEFFVRVEDNGAGDFLETTQASIDSALKAAYGADSLVIKQSDYIGPKFSANLASQSLFLTLIAIACILAYVWIRFHLDYAVTAIVALFHDTLAVLGFIGAFQIELNTISIAAVLTIIGYSLNDTIVVYDRIRENLQLMRGNELDSIVNTSITESLSRTIITNLTTQLAIISLLIFAQGDIKVFALELTVGTIFGTYSTIFVASPLWYEWRKKAAKSKKDKELKLYGANVKKAES